MLIIYTRDERRRRETQEVQSQQFTISASVAMFLVDFFIGVNQQLSQAILAVLMLLEPKTGPSSAECFGVTMLQRVNTVGASFARQG
jgi:hypothetical protein